VDWFHPPVFEVVHDSFPLEVFMATLRNLSFAGLLGLGILAGCGSSSNHDSRSSSERRDRDVTLSGERVDVDPHTARKVPRDARAVDEGRGSTLSYSARCDGEVYLTDASASTVIWDAKVRDGDRISVDPDHNRIEINGREQTKIDLKSNDRFQLYFLPTDFRSSRDYDYRR
jgi:hypothetical protein